MPNSWDEDPDQRRERHEAFMESGWARPSRSRRSFYNPHYKRTVRPPDDPPPLKPTSVWSSIVSVAFSIAKRLVWSQRE
jgi:hypothetical protein